MSRHPSVPTKPNSISMMQLSPEQQQERLQYSPIPNNKGLAGGVKRIKEQHGVEVTEHYLRRAITNRRINRHQICRLIYFSDRDLYDFIVLSTRKVGA